jgi:hypothetical protein
MMKNNYFLEKQRKKQLEVEMKIQNMLIEKITGLVDRLREKEVLLRDSTDEQYDVHREEVVSLVEELAMARKQYDKNLAAHREKNEAAAGSRAAGS